MPTPTKRLRAPKIYVGLPFVSAFQNLSLHFGQKQYRPVCLLLFRYAAISSGLYTCEKVQMKRPKATLNYFLQVKEKLNLFANGLKC